jgi:sigma-B regulation protein RsbU (phosphoserine phosphatase)
MVRSDGSVVRLECGGLVLGPLPEVTFEECELEINPGDRVLLFTDGVTEAANSGGEEFGDERLISSAVKSKRNDAIRLKVDIMSTLNAFSGGVFTDDVTLVTIAAD